ncbi:MAG TPA: four helix bundle protein [Bacteroidia bacterium]|jgi:four helix bundle protein|nr:four helix bundle protein [Bacteroidia bacterium]
MATFKKFEEIEVWQKARLLDLDIFKLIEETKICKDFKLKDQMLGSSGSIMDNIAEGFGRGGNREFIQFLYISKGSCLELMSQSYRAFDRKYITEPNLNGLLEKLQEINNKIGSLVSYLSRSDIRGPKYKQADTKRLNSETRNN